MISNRVALQTTLSEVSGVHQCADGAVDSLLRVRSLCLFIKVSDGTSQVRRS